MPEQKIESRRAFFKNAGKLVGGVALAAPFLTATLQDAEAGQITEGTSNKGCIGGGCQSTCSLACGGCGNSCNRACSLNCTGTAKK